MQHLKKNLTELLSLTRSFIKESHSPGHFVSVTPETLNYFRRTHKKQKASPKPPIIKAPDSTPIFIPTPTPPQNLPKSIEKTPPVQPKNLKNIDAPKEILKPKVLETPAVQKAKPLIFERQNIQQNTASFETGRFFDTFSQLFPHLTLHQSLPSDERALQIKHRWKKNNQKPDVIILSFRGGERERIFLENVAKAISSRFAPAKLISANSQEYQNKWSQYLEDPSLKLIIASDYEIYSEPQFMKFYKEEPNNAKYFFDKIPLLLLSDPSLYLQQPQLKAFLWRTICNEFALMNISSTS